jgi:multimeric flavodoxin WrbA
MKLLVLNGSPRPKGSVHSLLAAAADEASRRHEVEWVDVYKLNMRNCMGCMKCRPSSTCVLPRDDAQEMGQKIAAADGLIVGTPTHWGNMSAPLLTLFARNVPALMIDRQGRFPVRRQKGKPAAIVAACSTPWPFNVIYAESRGSVRAVKEVLRWGGYRLRGVVVHPNTWVKPDIPPKTLAKARRLGQKF